MKISKQLIIPDRVRKINGNFSFIPRAFLLNGFFSSLNQHELLLYFFLVLVGDRHGLSYYSADKLCTMLRMTIDQLLTARNSLIHKSLIAFDGFLFQVLSLPDKSLTQAPPPLTTQEEFEREDPMTIRHLVRQSLE